jgi:predicted transcriptional regulator
VTLKEVQDILEAEVLVGRDQLQKPVRTAFAADLMSDVLAFAKPDSLLLTGLTNPQVVRTADILDITAIILVRGEGGPHGFLQLVATDKDLGLQNILHLFQGHSVLLST